MAKNKLDDFEKEYAQKIFLEFTHANQIFNEAQANFNQKNSAVVGFYEFVKRKYDLPDDARLTPEGEIVLPDVHPFPPPGEA